MWSHTRWWICQPHNSFSMGPCLHMSCQYTSAHIGSQDHTNIALPSWLFICFYHDLFCISLVVIHLFLCIFCYFYCNVWGKLSKGTKSMSELHWIFYVIAEISVGCDVMYLNKVLLLIGWIISGDYQIWWRESGGCCSPERLVVHTDPQKP